MNWPRRRAGGAFGTAAPLKRARWASADAAGQAARSRGWWAPRCGPRGQLPHRHRRSAQTQAGTEAQVTSEVGSRCPAAASESAEASTAPLRASSRRVSLPGARERTSRRPENSSLAAFALLSRARIRGHVTPPSPAAFRPAPRITHPLTCRRPGTTMPRSPRAAARSLVSAATMAPDKIGCLTCWIEFSSYDGGKRWL
jgi:hypothetical protein